MARDRGFAEAEDYAPRIATRLVRCIREHSRSHQPPRDDRDLPSRAEQRALLLEVLGREGQVVEQAANRYAVRQQKADLMVVLTPDQWEQMVHRRGQRRQQLLEHFGELFASSP